MVPSHTSITSSTRTTEPSDSQCAETPPLFSPITLPLFPPPPPPPPPLIIPFELPPSPSRTPVDHYPIPITAFSSASTIRPPNDSRSSSPLDALSSTESDPESPFVGEPYYYPPDDSSFGYLTSQNRQLVNARRPHRSGWQRFLIALDRLDRTPTMLLALGLSLWAIGLFFLAYSTWLRGGREQREG